MVDTVNDKMYIELADGVSRIPRLAITSMSTKRKRDLTGSQAHNLLALSTHARERPANGYTEVP